MRHLPFAFVVTAALGHGIALPAAAIGEGEARTAAEQAIADVERRLDEVLKAKPASRPTPEQRLAAAEVLLRQRNFSRASEIFAQVVELFRQGQTTKPVHADALFLLAESYFRDDQLLSARRHYLEIVSLADGAPYDSYLGRSLGRLVDVALRTGRTDELQFVLAQVDQAASRKASTALRYAKAKALFALDRYDESERLLVPIAKTSSMYPQAQYILGVIYMKRALAPNPVLPTEKEAEVVPPAARRFARAVLQFQKVTGLEVETEEHRHVVDLAWMALGRLFYEVDDLLDAADAHARVRRDSPEFADMLFELSWVYVRLADFERAERGLEVLGVVSPDKLDFAEGALLRADLMLRSEQFDPALSAYRAVRRRFEPIQSEVDEFVARNVDPASYYDRLLEDRSGVRTRGALPPVVMDWLREESADDRVFALIEDMTASHLVLERSQRTMLRLRSVLASPVRVRGFPEIATRLQGVVGLMNEIALARRDLAEALAAESGAVGGEIGRAREERREATERMRWFPVATRDFSQREASGLRRWNGTSQKLQRLQLEVDKLHAMANGLERLLREKDRFGVALDAAVEARVRAELAQTEQEIEAYFQTIERYRESIEGSRLQVGFGDARYQNDDRARDAFRRAFDREFAELLAGRGGQSARELATEFAPLVERLDQLERKLAEHRRAFESEVEERTVAINAAVLEEQARLDAQARDLAALDQEARVLVGQAAMRDFERVRERLRGIVLRADVGITHHAWEVREHHLERVQRLQRERAVEERSLEEERDEVLFHGEKLP